MMDLRLKKLNAKDTQREYEFFQTMPVVSDFSVNYRGWSFDDFATQAIPDRLLAANGYGLPAGHVPETYYFLWADNLIVGLFKLHHQLNDCLRSGLGHIRYGILPDFRGRHFATRGLNMLLPIAARTLPAGEREALLTCSRDNEAALQVMRRSGATISVTDAQHYYVKLELPERR